MASILILSNRGKAASLGIRLAQDGHIVKIWAKDERDRALLQGFKNPTQVTSPERMLEQYDLITCDAVGLGDKMDSLREKGKLTFGGGSFNDRLELDRLYGERVISTLCPGVKIPEGGVEKITSKTVLLTRLKEKTPYVIKPLGNKATSLTLVSLKEDNKALLSIAEKLGDKMLPCVLQKRIDGGIEISTEGFFDGADWVLPFNHTIEEKRLMNEAIGPQTGCAGNTVWTCGEDKVVKTVLLPLTELLRKVNYVGPIDVNSIITPKDLYFLEFTTRWGFDAIQALCELLKVDLFTLMWNICTRRAKEVPALPGYGFSVRLSMPPYPSGKDYSHLDGIIPVSVSKDAQRHWWPMDVRLNQRGEECMAGVEGEVGCVTSRGSNVRECQRRTYRTIKNIIIHPDVQYRTDIGKGVEDEVNTLKEWGWL